MSKLESFILISFGYFIFEVLFIRIGFIFGITIDNATLISSILVYIIIMSITLIIIKSSLDTKITLFYSLIGFMVFTSVLAVFTIFLSKSYDTSWDGQGYHQTAVIALASGWNPSREATITLKQRLPSQIFAEGYPSSLWEVEASIYALTGKINTAKVVNMQVAILAGILFYIFLRKLDFKKPMAAIISLLVVLQPVYLLQLLSFMQDGFGYEILVIASVSLALVALNSKVHLALVTYDSKLNWTISIFIMAELILVTTKYSNLPAALIFGVIFVLIIVNRFLNKDYMINKWIKYQLVGGFIVCILFAYIPYIRNIELHNAVFYPTNIPSLFGSVRYNNVPNNLADANKFKLYFYGIFSKSQSAKSGDPRSPFNIAELKIPFTFSIDEIRDSVSLYNNRVGAGGPLFSGIVLLTTYYLVFMSVISRSIKERYALYISYFCIGLITFLAILTPTPNLLRYTNQIQLLPFVVIIPLYAAFKRKYVPAFTWFCILLIFFNFGFYAYAVTEKDINETKLMNKQFNEMRNSGKEYQVRAQQFYSSYIILSEQKIPYIAVDKLNCKNSGTLFASSSTTQYCLTDSRL